MVSEVRRLSVNQLGHSVPSSGGEPELVVIRGSEALRPYPPNGRTGVLGTWAAPITPG